jgi:hypothetical protein
MRGRFLATTRVAADNALGSDRPHPGRTRSVHSYNENNRSRSNKNCILFSNRNFCAAAGVATTARLVSVAKDISPFEIRAISRFSSTFFLATYMCIVSHS